MDMVRKHHIHFFLRVLPSAFALVKPRPATCFVRSSNP